MAATQLQQILHGFKIAVIAGKKLVVSLDTSIVTWLTVYLFLIRNLTNPVASFMHKTRVRKKSVRLTHLLIMKINSQPIILYNASASTDGTGLIKWSGLVFIRL